MNQPVLVLNAALSLFWHLVSGEIRQFIPRPYGFFDNAIVQAKFYLEHAGQDFGGVEAAWSENIVWGSFLVGNDVALVACGNMVEQALIAAVRSVPGVWLLGHTSDPDHHRSVLTFAGSFGLFCTLFLLFMRFLPVFAMAELKAVMPQADPHGEHNGHGAGGGH